MGAIVTHQTALEDQGKKNERVQAIIRAAYEIMGRDGFVNVSLADIAAEAGISKALLHYYFKDKDELVGEIYRHAMKHYLDIAMSVLNEPLPLGDRIDRLIESFHTFIQANPNWFSVVMELTVLGLKNPVRKGEILSQHVFIRDLTADIFKKAKEEGEFSPRIDEEVLASIMVAMANGFAMSYAIAREATDIPEFFAYFKKMVVDLIGTDKGNDDIHS
jgi:AcrR family transcriptional regulator